MAMPVAMDGKHGFQLALAGNNYNFKTAMTTTTTSTTTNSTTTTTTTTSDDDHGCNWNGNCSPVVDWDAFFSGPHEFQYLIDYMMGDEDMHSDCQVIEEEGSNSAVSPSTTDMVIVDEETRFEDVKGVRLVHLLMAAAEALVGSSQCTDLARVILVRLKELVSPTEGTNMERLAAHFAEALQALLEGSAGGSSHRNKHAIKNSLHCDQHHQEDMLAAFQLLQDMSPCVKFGHFTANQAILEAVSNDKRVHIVDYDIMEGIQWASLMQAFVSRKDGAPAPHLRITALSRGGSGRRSIGTVQETGRRLAAFAASIGQPFSFHQCRLDSDETFKPSSLKLVQGEALVFNCMLHLPHFNYRAPDSVASFLRGANSLNPRLLALVEEELGHNQDTGFLGRFMDSLHHYSAMYDSLEAGFPLQRRARALVERVLFGPQISGSLTRIYQHNGEKESVPWGEFLSEIGFKPMSMSSANHCQAKLLLGLYNDGYSVEELAKNKLVLGWKSRPLLSASIWCSHTSQSSEL